MVRDDWSGIPPGREGLRALLEQVRGEVRRRLVLGETPSPEDWRHEDPEVAEEISAAVAACLLEHALEHAPAGPEIVLADVRSHIQDAVNAGRDFDLSPWVAEHPELEADLIQLAREAGLIDAHLHATDFLAGLAELQSGERLGPFTLADPVADHPLGRWFPAHSSEGPSELLVFWPGIDPEAAARASEDAARLGRLKSPSLLGGIGSGADRGHRYVVCQAAEGPPLELAMDALRRSLPSQGAAPFFPMLRPALQVLADAARQLDRAHRLGFVHRALHPASILVRRPHGAAIRGAGFGAVVLDGILLNARLAPWLAPEVRRREASTSPHLADVFGVGLIAQRLLSTAPAVTSPRALSPSSGVPAELWALLARCAAEEPAGRPSDCGMIAEALSAAAD